MASSILLVVLFTAVFGKPDVMRHLCENPINPACKGTFIPPKDINPPNCELKCDVQIPPIDRTLFCAEQLPYTSTSTSATNQGSQVICKYSTLQSCEEGNYFVGKCVKYHATRLTYTEAEAKCKKDKAVLETFNSKKQKLWVQMSTLISEPAIWTKPSSDGNVLLLADNDLGTAGTVTKSNGDHQKLSFFCSVPKKTYNLAHEIYCKALRTLNLAARFESGKCMVMTSSMWSGTQANSGIELHNLCMNISPFDGRSAVNFRERESNHMKSLVKEFYADMIIQPTAATKPDPFDEWCSNRTQQTAPLLHSFITQNDGTKSSLFEIPYYTYVDRKFFPYCEAAQGQFKIASVGKIAEGNVPIANTFSLPSSCLIAPDLSNAVVGKCDPGWNAFEKYEGFVWCIKYVHHGPKTFNESALECEKQNAIITGFENELEYKQLLDDAATGMKKSNVIEGSVWLGSNRKLECKNANHESPPPCHYQQQFEWIDGVTKGGFAFTHWGNGEPNNWSNENVLTMVVRPGLRLHGTMNDIPFDHTSNKVNVFYSMQGSFCGKRASMT